MSAAKHTPGPWDKGRAGGIGQVFNADGRKVCDVMTNLGDLNLIATAPELLEQLIRCRAKLLTVLAETPPDDQPKRRVIERQLAEAGEVILKAMGAQP